MARTVKKSDYYFANEDSKFDRNKRNFKKIRSSVKNRLKSINIDSLDEEEFDLEDDE